MRKIKFRVVVSGTMVGYESLRDGSWYKSENGFDWVRGTFGGKHYVRYQYIGLKDKNGVEIYDGDVCRDRPGNKFRIIYYEYQFKPDRSFMNLTGLLKDIEVISNVYENPELLKETK